MKVYAFVRFNNSSRSLFKCYTNVLIYSKLSDQMRISDVNGLNGSRRMINSTDACSPGLTAPVSALARENVP